MDPVVAARMEKELIGTSLGRWKLDGALGAGKSALVFSATDGTQRAAVKVFDRDLVARFGAEIQRQRIAREALLVGVRHPHLIEILDAGEDPSRDLFYVAMALAPPTNLAQVLVSVPDAQVRVILAQVAMAARFLEEMTLVHRDIKPENIAISSDFANSILLDLGVLKPAEGLAEITDHGGQRAFVGTLQYSPPEYLFRAEDGSLEGWRAITFYQLGAVLYDLLERRPLFDGVSPYAAMVMAVRERIPEFKRFDTPSDLRQLARNCLVKDPAVRLSLVRWEDFTLAAPAQTIEIAAARIAARRRATAAASLDSTGAAKGLLWAVVRAIETGVQRAIRLDGFPPIARADEIEDTCACVDVRLEPTGSATLKGPVAVTFRVSLLEARFATICIRAAASAGAPGEMWARGANAPMPTEAVVLLEGQLDETRVAEVTHEFLIGALDAAEEFFSENGSVSLLVGLAPEGSWTQLGG